MLIALRLSSSEKNMTIIFSAVLGMFAVALIGFMLHKCKHKIQYLHRPLNTDDTGKQFPFIVQSKQTFFYYLQQKKSSTYSIFPRCICGRRWHTRNFWRTLWWPSDIRQRTNSLRRPISIPPRVPSLRRERSYSLRSPFVLDRHGPNQVFTTAKEYNFKTEISPQLYWISSRKANSREEGKMTLGRTFKKGQRWLMWTLLLLLYLSIPR